MIFVLDATNKSLRFSITAGAGSDVHFTSHWADATATGLTEGQTQGTSNGSTAVDAVPAPAASTRRVVKLITFYNTNASTSRTVTLVNDVGGTSRTIATFTLAPLATWYSDSATTSGLIDRDYGDITVSGNGATLTIDSDAVTYAKMQNVSAEQRVLGRKLGAGSGDVQECTLSEVLDFVGSAAQGDILYRGASTWTRLGAGTSGRLLQTKGSSANPEWALDSMTTSSISPTSANQTAAVNTRYFADISGLTANRNFILPAGTAGDRIELSITVGDNEFAFVIIGDTNIKINNGTAATEWSRLFIDGESITLMATSATNWQVVVDGRIPTLARMHYAGSQVTIPSGGNGTVAALNTVKFDNTPQALTTLDGALNNSATTITVVSTAAFRSTGGIRVGSESISYTGKTSTTFTGCTRAFAGTTAASHSSGASVSQSSVCYITTSRIIPRRTNKYLITAGYRWVTLTANASRIIAWIEDPVLTPPANVQQLEVSALSGCIPNLSLATTSECVAGNYLQMLVFQNTGGDVLSNSIAEIIHLEIAEAL